LHIVLLAEDVGGRHGTTVWFERGLRALMFLNNLVGSI
jgi:hypothetical protein